MKVIFYLTVLCCSTIHVHAQTKILLVTGGHDFEEKEFFEMFDSFRDFEYDHVIQPNANVLIESGDLDKYDALVFYDMYDSITESQKLAYLKLLNEGLGFVFLHHTLVSYQDWLEFQNIIGGKYLRNATSSHPKSTYKHDVHIDVSIVDKAHPITKGLSNFEILDEVYGRFIVNKEVTPLLKTNHPESTETIGWCHTYQKSKIVYLQSGHDHHAYVSDDFRKLLKNSIEWVSK